VGSSTVALADELYGKATWDQSVTVVFFAASCSRLIRSKISSRWTETFLGAAAIPLSETHALSALCYDMSVNCLEL
jgi:hypothetical protein